MSVAFLCTQNKTQYPSPVSDLLRRMVLATSLPVSSASLPVTYFGLLPGTDQVLWPFNAFSLHLECSSPWPAFWLTHPSDFSLRIITLAGLPFWGGVPHPHLHYCLSWHEGCPSWYLKQSVIVGLLLIYSFIGSRPTRVGTFPRIVFGTQ